MSHNVVPNSLSYIYFTHYKVDPIWRIECLWNSLQYPSSSRLAPNFGTPTDIVLYINKKTIAVLVIISGQRSNLLPEKMSS